MKITETDPVFDNNLESHTYSRRAVVISLMDEIENASNIDELRFVSACSDSDIHFVYNYVCKLYFELLEENRVKLLNFVFAGYDKARD